MADLWYDSLELAYGSAGISFSKNSLRWDSSLFSYIWSLGLCCSYDHGGEQLAIPFLNLKMEINLSLVSGT